MRVKAYFSIRGQYGERELTYKAHSPGSAGVQLLNILPEFRDRIQIRTIHSIHTPDAKSFTLYDGARQTQYSK